jgi:hypothetical protein
MKRRNEPAKEYQQAHDYDFLTHVLEQPMNFLRELETARCPHDKLMCVNRAAAQELPVGRLAGRGRAGAQLNTALHRKCRPAHRSQ